MPQDDDHRHDDQERSASAGRVSDGGFTELKLWYREHRRDLTAFARRWAGPGIGAQDIVQEALRRAWERHRQLTTADPRTWLRAFVRNVGREVERARRTNIPTVPLEGIPEPGCRDPDIEALARAEEDERNRAALALRQLERTITALPPTERRVFRLWLEGRSLVQIATVLGKTPGAARAAKHKASQKLLRAFPSLDTKKLRQVWPEVQDTPPVGDAGIGNPQHFGPSLSANVGGDAGTGDD